MLVMRFHKKDLLCFITLLSLPKCFVFYTCVFNHHLRGSFESRSHFISGLNVIVRVSVVLNIMVSTVVNADKDDPRLSFIPILF